MLSRNADCAQGAGCRVNDSHYSLRLDQGAHQRSAELATRSMNRQRLSYAFTLAQVSFLMQHPRVHSCSRFNCMKARRSLSRLKADGHSESTIGARPFRERWRPKPNAQHARRSSNLTSFETELSCSRPAAWSIECGWSRSRTWKCAEKPARYSHEAGQTGSSRTLSQ